MSAVTFLKVDSLSVRLGEYVALDRIDFSTEPGDFVAIMGPNGAGKTTLLKAILGLIAASEGRITIDGLPADRLASGAIGYVPQIKTLDRTFPATSLELVLSGERRAWPWTISRAARAAGREALANVRADHLVDRRVARLSGGELQRIYLARAFIRRPRLVLLDEPATGIDAAGEADLYHLLEAYQKESGATVLMITHDWETAFHHATKLLLLNRRCISFGPPENAAREADLREAFGHVGHEHAMHVGHHGHHHGGSVND